MADFLNDYSNVNIAADAVGGFLKGMQAGEDQKMKRLEFDAKMKSQDSEMERRKFQDALEMRKAGLQKGADGSLQEMPGFKHRENIISLAGSGQRPVYDESGQLTGSEYKPGYLEAQRRKTDAESGKQTNQFTDSLRDDWMKDPTTKATKEVARAYKQIQKVGSTPSPAGDISLLISYMKMLDPGSTVREGEFATAQNAASVPDQIRNQYNRMTKGERLNPTQRADFIKQAGGVYQSQMQSQKLFDESFRKVASRRGANPDDIVMSDMFESADVQPQGLVPKGLIKKGGLVKPGAAPAQQLSGEDAEAVAWAQANPKDPRSAEILRKNGL